MQNDKKEDIRRRKRKGGYDESLKTGTENIGRKEMKPK